MKQILVQQAAFQGVWLACAIGGAAGAAWPGVATAATFMAIHLAFSRQAARDLTVVGVALVCGWLLDAVIVGGSLVSYPGSPLALGPSPLWMLALWAAFALTVPVAFGWLAGRAGLGTAVGAVGGIVAYFAGSRLGALEVAGGSGWLAIGVGWGLAMPILVAIAHRSSMLSWAGAPIHAGDEVEC